MVGKEKEGLNRATDKKKGRKNAFEKRTFIKFSVPMGKE